MDPIEGPWLYGYAVKGVKSLRSQQPAKVGPLAKVNFLVGRNNHGKSTLLRTAATWTSKTKSGFRVETDDVATLAPIRGRVLRGAERHAKLRVDQMLSDGTIVRIDDERLGVWMPGRLTADQLKGPAIHSVAKKTIGANQALHGVEDAPPGPSASVLIPAFRALTPPPQAEEGNPKAPPANLAAGEGLVAELGRWQNPINPSSPEYKAARKRWERLQEFMRDVLEDPEADLEVASNQEDLHVRLAQAREMLHINDLGDGVKQVLMIAAACIRYDDHLVLLEEPEIHLHAGLQRKLMGFLAERTDNQYIVATHSAHMLDLPGAQIFHVTHDGESSKVSRAVRASDVQRVCQDLGYMASDLLQANYTIWVEGPSDRIYWRRWLELVDPELVEGVHFTVMAYGGYLIDGVHLGDEPDESTETKDLIQLLQLGRQCTVIADSDKDAAEAELRPTLVRLQEEAQKPGSGDLVVCEWASTIENLLPRGLFRDTVIEAHPKAGKRLRKDSHHAYADPFAGMGKGTYSKVEIAKRVAAKLTTDDVDEQLAQVVTELARRIRGANGLAAVDRGGETE